MAYALREFGSYTVGGRIVEVTEGEPRTIRFTREAEYTYDPRGHFAIAQTYVQFFVPERLRDLPPVVLVHGGGLHGSTWETTPDGRPGWLHGLLDAGREVHVVDAVERGRAGFAPGHFRGDPILRSLEEAWVLFRFGRAEDFARRIPFERQQFPVAWLETFARSFAPRWLTTAALQRAGLLAVLERLPGAVVVCHSQGGEQVFDALAERPGLASVVAAVEPSALPADPATLRGVRLAVIQGDHLDCASHWQERAGRWQALVEACAAAGERAVLIDTVREIAAGGSHMLMMDRHSGDCLAALLPHLEP